MASRPKLMKPLSQIFMKPGPMPPPVATEERADPPGLRFELEPHIANEIAKQNAHLVSVSNAVNAAVQGLMLGSGAYLLKDLPEEKRRNFRLSVDGKAIIVPD